MLVPPVAHRVSNDLATIFGGSSRRKLVILINRRDCLALTNEADLLAAMAGRVGLVVMGVAVLQPRGNRYHAELLLGSDVGYDHILRSLVLATADRDGYPHVAWSDEEDHPVPSRSWGPFAGLRRRGISVRKRFQHQTNLHNEHMVRFIEALWRLFSISRGEPPPAVTESTVE